VFLGRDKNGKVRLLEVTFKGGKRQAQRELNRLIAEVEERQALGKQAPEPVSPDWGPDTTFNDAIRG
jgi:hypothetical protein